MLRNTVPRMHVKDVGFNPQTFSTWTVNRRQKITSHSGHLIREGALGTIV
jgi:hypothetical protein